MKKMFKNIASSLYLKVVAVVFILNFLFDFYSSIRIDSIDELITGTLTNITYFLILYALGVLIKEKGSQK